MQIWEATVQVSQGPPPSRSLSSREGAQVREDSTEAESFSTDGLWVTEEGLGVLSTGDKAERNKVWVLSPKMSAGVKCHKE